MEDFLVNCTACLFISWSLMGFARAASYYKNRCPKKDLIASVVLAVSAGICAGMVSLSFLLSHGADKLFAGSVALMCAYLGADFLEMIKHIAIKKLDFFVERFEQTKEQSSEVSKQKKPPMAKLCQKGKAKSESAD